MARSKKEGGIDEWAERQRQHLGMNASGEQPAVVRSPGSVQRKVSIGAYGRRLQMGVGGTASRRHANKPRSKKKY